MPPLQVIVDAIMTSRGVTNDKRGGYTNSVRSHAALLPAVGLATLPKLTCPMCWPAYAGLLSSFGIGFVNYTPYLLPLTGTFLLISVLALAYRAERRQGYGPFALGVLAVLTVLAGKFRYDSDGAMWLRLAVLVIASIWNSWPVGHGQDAANDADCEACSGIAGMHP